MNIKQLQERRKSLLDKLEAAETIEDINSVKTEIDSVDASIAAMEQKAALIAQLGTKSGRPEKVMTAAVTLGDAAADLVTMSAILDNTRVNRDVRTIMDEIVSQLMQLDGVDVELCFEVHARVDEGIPVPTTRALTENCNTLHIGDYRFDG